MAAMWYVMQNGQRLGPYSAETFQEMVDRRQIAPDDLVWCEGMADWARTRSVVKPSDYRAPRARRRYEDEDDREDDYRQLRRRPARSGPPPQFPGRLITPSFFFLCILLFFCPWVDVRCSGTTIAHQSGLQLTYGGYSETYILDMERQAGKAVPNNVEVGASPLVIGFGGLVLAGFLFGLALPTGLVRILLTAAPAFVAFVLLMIQLAVGFPMKDSVDRMNRTRPPEPRVFGAMPGAPPPFFPNPGGNQLYVSTTPWFWLAVMFCLCVNGGLLIEHLAIFGASKGRPPEEDG